MLQRRAEAESKIKPEFDKHSQELYDLIKSILQRYQDGDLTREEAYEEMLEKVGNEISKFSFNIEPILEKYLIEDYKIGKELMNEEPTLSSFDVLVLVVLLRVAQKYIYKAQRAIFGRAIKEVVKSKLEEEIKIPTLEFIEDRFYKIIVSEGSRTIAQGALQVAIGSGLMVIFHTLEDERVCVECSSLNGRTFFAHDALGLIPLHVHCRCYFELYEVEMK